jgi:hypothetical protein
MEGMQFYKDYFNNIGKQMKQREYIQKRFKEEYENEPKETKTKRRENMSRIVKDIEEMVSMEKDDYKSITQGY